ncbi:MAG TPA: radical SAM protein, partial [Candidatus Margulisiibacteriota bacterium]|nr:radical SAM protein [Candidatus Margulisiibacteriota bacterium]
KLVKGHIPEDLNSLPAPDRSILYKYAEFGKARMKRFIAARDCPNACAYCFNHLYHKLYSEEKHRFFQRASPDKVIEEIKEVRQQYGLELAYFNDDDFAADHAWLDEFCAKYKSKVGLPFCGSIRANSVDYGLLKMMAEAGCVFLNIALESANIETQKLLRRGAITNQQIEEACRDCGQVGIMVRLQNMIGLPVEDPLKDALETLAFNMKINPTDSWAAIYQPFPKTELWEYCIKKGLVREDAECVNFHDYTILSIPDAEKLNRLHKWWFFAIKHQIPSELLAILLELPLTDEEETKLQDLRWRIAAQTLYGM